MELKDVQEFIEQNQGNENVQTFISGLNPVNLDRVKTFVTDTEDEDVKSWFDEEKNSHLESWKTSNLEQIIADEVAKSKGENLTPEQKKIAELELWKANSEKAEIKSAIKSKAMDYVNEQKLPLNSKTIEVFIGEDEKSTLNKLKEFAEDHKKFCEELLKSKASGSYVPPKNNSGETVSLGEQFAKTRNDKNTKLKTEEDKKVNPYSNTWSM